MALLAIVILAFISPQADAPPDKQIQGRTQQTEYAKTDYRGPAEGYWWPEFAARDTYAQWAMAVLALAATVISVVAIILLKRTLEATRDTVTAANRTADEAKRIGEAQVRAYLSSDGGDFHINNDVIWFEFALKNSGQSPLIADRITPVLILVPPDVGIEMHNLAGHFSSIPAGSPSTCRLHVPRQKVGEEMIERIQSGETHVVVQATFFWKDVFGNDLWATYVFTQEGPPFMKDVDGRFFSAGEFHATCVAAYWGERRSH